MACNQHWYPIAGSRARVYVSAMVEQSSSVGVFRVEDFPKSGGKFSGNWTAGTSYPLCATVSHQGADWIATTNRATGEPHQFPAGGPVLWAKFDSTGAGIAATRADCAFFVAYAYVQSHSTSFLIPAGADLEFQSPMRGYDKNGDWVMPSNTFGYSVSMHGRGRSATVINQAVSTNGYMILQEPLGNAKIVSQEIIGIDFNANLLAGGCLSIHGVRRSHYRKLPASTHNNKKADRSKPRCTLDIRATVMKSHSIRVSYVRRHIQAPRRHLRPRQSVAAR